MTKRNMIAIGCLLGGITLMINGSYIHLKAMLGQWMIAQAWQQSTEHSKQKPWPWMDTWPVGKLSFPKQHIDQIVLEGDSGQALAFGPGHRIGSALPGKPGTVLISGHKDTHFNFLQDVELEDIVELTDTNGVRHQYRVEQFNVVQASDQLISVPDESLLVLATCWPFDILKESTQRFIVIARLQEDHIKNSENELVGMNAD